jgi:hypothetical protein
VVSGEWNFLPAVKNGYADSCHDDDFFDLSYADLGQPKPNFVFFYFYLPLKTATLIVAKTMISLIYRTRVLRPAFSQPSAAAQQPLKST